MSEREMDPTPLEKAEPLRRIDQVMEIVGIALLPVGLTALLIGWLGVASNGLVFLQLPYVVSGGLLGVGLLFASGTIYLASWISRTAAVQRRQNDELLRALTQLQQTVAVLPLAGASGQGRAGNGGRGHGGQYVATPSGTMFHRPDCAIVTGREDLREVEPDDSRMKPCGMCAPLDADATTVIPTHN